jgi:glycosyltransferase involved in cell wall biosynthesis
MKIVVFSYPSYSPFRSIHKYTTMLVDGMRGLGHEVSVWRPEQYMYRTWLPGPIRKWAGYFDQFILFPVVVKRRLKTADPATLFVFSDHSQGIWIPLLSHRRHVIHCHDFMAQDSALGHVPENRLSWTGRFYQQLIRKGFSSGKNFISVSRHTQEGLHRFLGSQPPVSEIVYNGLSGPFTLRNKQITRKRLQQSTGLGVQNGYLLHVGGNQWYKNREAVVSIYNQWRKISTQDLPLLLVGDQPTSGLRKALDESPFQHTIYLLTRITDDQLPSLYSGADLLVFPSLSEGFGWPIAEAMASGCPVITTGEKPMTEVGSNAAFYIPRKPQKVCDQQCWVTTAALLADEILTMPLAGYQQVVSAGIKNAQRFNQSKALKAIESVYLSIC